MVAAVRAKRSAPENDSTMEVDGGTTNKMQDLLSGSAKKTRLLFTNTYGQAAMDEPER